MSLNNQTVGEMVAQDYRTAKVFENYGLDFCCGGNKTLKEAAAAKGIDPKMIEKALVNMNCSNQKEYHYDNWALDFLVNYIINNHHRFTRDKLPEMAGYMKKVKDVHGDEHPELNDMYNIFSSLYADMINHLDKEERILFPYIKKLVETRGNDTTAEKSAFGKAANAIAMMEEEHDEAGEAMKEMRKLSNGFTPPADACTTYRVLFENLEAFEKDLHKHVHLENNILFPKALKMEYALNAE